jgi:hypothetical protein
MEQRKLGRPRTSPLGALAHAVRMFLKKSISHIGHLFVGCVAACFETQSKPRTRPKTYSFESFLNFTRSEEMRRFPHGYTD